MESVPVGDSQYTKLRPDGGSLHLRREESPLQNLEYAEYSDQELTPAASREPEKVAIIYSLPKLLFQILLHLVPVGLSFAILQLSFRNIYWRGAGGSGSGHLRRYSTNEVLSILQIVAKVHEILIVLSLSYIVLYYLRRQLISAEGVSFGCVYSSFLFCLP